MKSKIYIITFLAAIVLTPGFKLVQEDEIELVCVKKHNASNVCHYNFKIGGVKYNYLDVGCRGRKEEVLKKAKNGKLGLAKDWKLECPLKKDE
jgi:hypothetical protein